MDLMGVRINTIVKDNVAIRCDGCNEVIVGNIGPIYVLNASLSDTGLNLSGSLPLNHLAAVAIGQLGGRWAVVGNH